MVVTLSLFINLSLFGIGYHKWDVSTQQGWGEIALKKGVSGVYLDGNADYPPLYIYVLKVNALANSLFNNNSKSTAIFISKTIPTLCNLLIGLFLFLHLRRKDYKVAILCMCLYLFNLAVIYDTAYWGQVDSVNTLFMFLSVLFLIQKRFIFSSVFITLAVLTKFQSIILLPIIIIIILMNCNYKMLLKLALYNILTVLIILLPFVFGGTFLYVINVYINSVGKYPHVTMNAFNFWYLISPINSARWQNTLNDNLVFFGFSLKQIGLILFAFYVLLVIYQLIKNKQKDNIILASSSVAFAFFMLPTQIHERYLFPFFALFSLIAYKNKKYLLIYITLSITFLLNLMMVLSFQSNSHFIFSSIKYLLGLTITTFSFRFVAIILALINLTLFIYLSRIGILNNLFLNIKKDFLKLKEAIHKYDG